MGRVKSFIFAVISTFIALSAHAMEKLIEEGYLQVSNIHQIYYAVYGNPEGIPVVVLHGGPGGGGKNDAIRLFDLDRYRVVLFDQRGAMRSRPFACMDENTTQNSIEDIEALRKALGIDKWIVWGGSWGSLLAMLYGESYSDSCLGFILYGIFLGRPEDIQLFEKKNDAAYEEFIKFFPEGERSDLLLASYSRIMDPNPEVHMEMARTLLRFHFMNTKGVPNPAAIESFVKDEKAALSLGRAVLHYATHKLFLQPDQVMQNIRMISHLPAVIITGDKDLVCPSDQAIKLHENWANSMLWIVKDGEHFSGDPKIAEALARAATLFANPDYCPRTYWEARDSFLKAAEGNPRVTRIDSLEIQARGPEDKPLFIDIAVMGDLQTANNILFHLSGTHGVEGGAGSGIQYAFLREVDAIAEDVAIVFIHALNPFGMAWNRRVNEHNVDLNRNCVTERVTPELYAIMDPVINPKTPKPFDTRAYKDLEDQYGASAVRSALLGGQYEFPEGLFYGGTEVEEGPRLILEWCRSRFAGMNQDKSMLRFGIIDVHSGLGPFGEDTLITIAKPTDLMMKVFGAKMNVAKQMAHIGYKATGVFVKQLKDALREFTQTHYDCLVIGQEFGTVKEDKVMAALYLENSLFHDALRRGEPYDPCGPGGTALMDAFYPDDPLWRKQILVSGRELILKSLCILKESEMTPIFTPPGDVSLQTPAIDVSVEEIVSEETQGIIEKLLRIAKGERDGITENQKAMVGLAAPQVGYSKRIVLVDVGVDCNRKLGSLVAYINPEITWYSDEIVESREGCYSVDGRLWGLVPRSKKIHVKALGRDGMPISEEFSGLTASIFQHEIDHLNGIRFPDRVGPEGKLHWVEESEYEDYKKNCAHWHCTCPWETWLAMKNSKPYAAPK